MTQYGRCLNLGSCCLYREPGFIGLSGYSITAGSLSEDSAETISLSEPGLNGFIGLTGYLTTAGSLLDDPAETIKLKSKWIYH
jgi:hypothetical protein